MESDLEEGYFEEDPIDYDMANITVPLKPIPAYITIQFAWYSFIFTLGVIGNLYITLTVTCRKEMTSTTNYFIFNLAVSDLGILLVSLPSHVIRDFFSWTFGKVACQVIISMNEVFFSVSICTITVITLERYRAIALPFKAKTSTRGGKVTIALIWLVSYLVIGFPMTFFMDLELIDQRLICLPKWPSKDVNKIQTCLIVTLIIIPLIVTAYAYTVMIKTLRQQSQRLQERANCHRVSRTSLNSSSSLKQDHRRHRYNAKLVKMLIIIVVVFWISMLPLTLLALVVEFFPEVRVASKEIDGLYTIFVALFYSNSAFNPVAIYIMSSDLRKGLNTLLFYKKRRLSEIRHLHFVGQN